MTQLCICSRKKIYLAVTHVLKSLHASANNKNSFQANDNCCSVHMAHEHLPALDNERINTDSVGCVSSMVLYLAVAWFAVLWNRPPLPLESGEAASKTERSDEPTSCKEQLHMHYWLNAFCCYSLPLFPLPSSGWRESWDVLSHFARITDPCCIRECFTIASISNRATKTSTHKYTQCLYGNQSLGSCCLLCYCVSAMANEIGLFFRHQYIVSITIT